MASPLTIDSDSKEQLTRSWSASEGARRELNVALEVELAPRAERSLNEEHRASSGFEPHATSRVAASRCAARRLHR